MPDLDIISRNLPAGWAKPMRFFVGTASAPETARSMIQAAAACLRDHDGFPGFERFSAILRKRLAGEIDPHSAYTLVQAAEHREAHHRHTKIAGRAARALLVEISQGGRLLAGVDQGLAEACCRALIDHNFFAHAKPESLGKHFPGRAALEVRERECLSALDAPLKRMARAVAADPGCRNLRAPAVPSYTRRSTEELLRESVM